MSKALIVVDVQNDFCEGGALAVKGGAKVASDISNFLENRHDKYDLVIATRDTHAAPPEDNCGHFALDSEPDYHSSWPVHCVKGTPGASYHPNLKLKYIDVHTTKGYGTQSYSGFESVDENGKSIISWLRSYDVKSIDVVGLALDYCVQQTAIDGSGLQFSSNVLADLTEAVHSHNKIGEFSLLELSGVCVLNSWYHV